MSSSSTSKMPENELVQLFARDVNLRLTDRGDAQRQA